jgi:exodeoxyribonuclease-5
MNIGILSNLLIKNFQYKTTAEQQIAINKLSIFFLNENSKSCFILKGYAGTGKTTLVNSIVKTLPHIKLKSVLLAPTGRSAKVLAKYSKQYASTIHKKIYWGNSVTFSYAHIRTQENKHTNTI